MCGTSLLPSSCSSSLRQYHESPQSRRRHMVVYCFSHRRFGGEFVLPVGVSFLTEKEETLGFRRRLRFSKLPRSYGGFQVQRFGRLVLPTSSTPVVDRELGGTAKKSSAAVPETIPTAIHLIQKSGLTLRRPPSVSIEKHGAVKRQVGFTDHKKPLLAFKIQPVKGKTRIARSNESSDTRTLRDFKPSRGTTDTLTGEVADVIAHLLRSRNDTGAVSTIMQEHENMLKHDISAALSELQQRQEWKWTLEFFSWMKEQVWYVPNARQYTKLIGFLGRVGKVDLACLYFQEMLLKNCKPDQYTFTAMVNAYGKAKMFDEALAVFTYMKEAQDEECRPTTVTCNALLDALVKGGKHELAIKMFTDMRAGLNGVGASCIPNVVTYNILMDALCKENMINTAFKILYQMSDKTADNAVSPNVATYNTLIDGCGKSGLYEKAEELMEHMQRYGIQPDRITYTALIDAYGKAGELESAENLFKGMQGSAIKVDVLACTAMIDAYAGEGLYEKAASLFQTMCDLKIRPNQVTYLALMEAYAKGCMPEEAKKIFISMQAHGCQPNVLHYSALVDAYGKAGKYKEAACAYKMMKKAYISPNIVTLSAVLGSATRCARWEDSLSLIACFEHSGTALERALCTLLLADEPVVWGTSLVTLERLKEPRHIRQSLYNSLMDFMWRFEMMDKAARVLQVCKQCGIYSDGYTSQEWYIDLHGLSVGGASIALLAWLTDLHVAWVWGEDIPLKIRVVTGKGKHARSKKSALRLPVERILNSFHSPFKSMEDEGFLAATGDATRSWLLSSDVKERIYLAAAGNLEGM